MMPDMGETSERAPRKSDKSLLQGVPDLDSDSLFSSPFYRIATHTLLFILILTISWGLRTYYLNQQTNNTKIELNTSTQTATPNIKPPTVDSIDLPTEHTMGVSRQVWFHTDIPSRSRSEVINYVVQTGETLYALADRFQLKPETILWANQKILGDDPHNLRSGQELIILPVDGTYHSWSAGESLFGVAKFYQADPEDIVLYPGNHLDPESIGDWSNPDIQPGTWLVVPGGSREFVNWSVPEITRDNPSTAQILGAGACELAADGAVGSEVFIWPTDNRFLSGFDFNPEINHQAIDIGGEEGDPVYASDSGVVVYAGWNDWGLGYMVVINHGNDWQTIYAHLGAIYVTCGQSIWQGEVIGAIGESGNASFPQLHFEMMFEGQYVIPQNYIK